MATKAVTDSSFETDVLQSDKPVLVDFWADWCGPCKMIGPALEEISEELKDRVTIAKMDIMANTSVPGEFGVKPWWTCTRGFDVRTGSRVTRSSCQPLSRV